MPHREGEAPQSSSLRDDDRIVEEHEAVRVIDILEP